MKIFSTYSVKIKYFNHIFKETVALYREAVDYLIEVCLNEWDDISVIKGSLNQQRYVECLCHETADNTNVRYSYFDKGFYKFPSYLRRGAINEAIGKVSSYKSNLANWEKEDKCLRGRKPSCPKAGYVYPCLYKTVMYKETGTYEAKIKVFIRNRKRYQAINPHFAKTGRY